MSFPTPTTNSVDYSKVYEPAEDSFLFLDMLEKDIEYIHSSIKSTLGNSSTPMVLEIGTGSGIVTSFVQQSILPHFPSIYFTTDLNIHACQASLATSLENIKNNNNNDNNNNNNSKRSIVIMDTFRASLASCLRPKIINLLLFNPPYVPEEYVPKIPKSDDDYEWLDLALLGGKDGMEVTWQVLEGLDEILSETLGIAYIIFCKRNRPEEVANVMKKRGWDSIKVGERKAGFEILSLWRFSRVGLSLKQI